MWPISPGVLLSLSVLTGLAGAASAQGVVDLADGRSGRIAFASPTPSGPTQLVRRSYGADFATIAGFLSLPEGAGRVPAVVLAHGSGGIVPGRENEWAARLNRLGYATFVVDSFTPRGLRSTATDQSKLSTMANLADALSALKLLATHPRIDPARIAVMGFSRGGQVALYSALEPLRQGVIDGALRFAAHVALYPSCNIPYRAERLTGAPMLILLGEKDDYTPAADCLAYAGWFRDKGAAIEVRTYPDAYHDFDTPGAPHFSSTVQTAKDCHAEVQVESGSVRRLDTGEALRQPDDIAAYFRACMKRGATYGGNAAALAAAEQDVAAFLARTIGAPR